MKTRLIRRWRQPRAPLIDLRGDRARPWLVILLGVIALGLWLLLWSDWQTLQVREAEAQQVERQFTALAIQQEQRMQASLRTSPQQKKQLETFARQSATPFALLDALGQAWSPDVALLRLEVNTAARELSLDLESQHLEGSLRFIEKLKTDTGLTVSLQQSARNTRDPMLPMSVKFKLSAQ
ncbi:hypothetical protein [Pseudomonas gingeri]|uniref:hypothetical protein n=1 Tax=Pseudomonas gingeri TaxID=117681 RepID=UPI0015A16416|nr:hypothetical protein [Pseudomonas gingeri]NWA05359.1 hypothetical protein [Pseudomonas gingeri]NWA18507.1 hypothetical protein [Pseudomonas gingeri]NWA53425.1 hypothetical protein [Pseudomonas gingeri]NWA95262.1 hypothetical protein [Pseudomonas gingeri]NWB00290.1 hypothetical protein [Pseudomonas gingeri]